MYRLVLLVCLSISLSKNSSSCCAIGFESGCKGKGFNFNHQMFSKVFLKKFFQGFLERAVGCMLLKVLSVLAPLATLR